MAGPFYLWCMGHAGRREVPFQYSFRTIRTEVSFLGEKERMLKASQSALV